jgi:hypothetical protein
MKRKLLLAGIILFSATFSVAMVALHLKKAAPVQPKALAKVINKEPLKGLIKGAIEQKLPELELCYNSYLSLGRPVKEGALKILWHIDANGEVASIAPGDNEFNDPDLMDCILNQARRWTLSLPAGEPVIYSHRFVFHERAVREMSFE